MKQLCVILTVMTCILQTSSYAQYLPKSIASYRLDICFDKTSNLIFPGAIKSVDRGSAAVLAQKATGVENVLQVKAGEQNFKPTNLTVITSDGHFYSFAVNYSSEPAILNVSFVGNDSEKAIISNQSISEASFNVVAAVIKSKRHLIHKGVWEQNIKLSLTNIFIKDDLLWLQLSVNNESLVPFRPSYVRFFQKDVKTSKQTATQENELLPLHKTPFYEVDAHASQSVVFAFTHFTIPDSKKLIVQLGESEGNRLLTLPVSHRIISKIRPLK